MKYIIVLLLAISASQADMPASFHFETSTSHDATPHAKIAYPASPATAFNTYRKAKWLPEPTVSVEPAYKSWSHWSSPSLFYGPQPSVKVVGEVPAPWEVKPATTWKVGTEAWKYSGSPEISTEWKFGAVEPWKIGAWKYSASPEIPSWKVGDQWAFTQKFSHPTEDKWVSGDKWAVSPVSGWKVAPVETTWKVGHEPSVWKYSAPEVPSWKVGGEKWAPKWVSEEKVAVSPVDKWVSGEKWVISPVGSVGKWVSEEKYGVAPVDKWVSGEKWTNTWSSSPSLYAAGPVHSWSSVPKPVSYYSSPIVQAEVKKEWAKPATVIQSPVEASKAFHYTSSVNHEVPKAHY